MERIAYVGCRTTKERNARGAGIEIYRVNDITGKWKHIGTEGNLENPSYLTFDKSKKYLYAVHGDFSEVSAFSVNKETGLLHSLGRVSCEGENPVYLIPDSTNHFILVANLQTGTVVALPRNNDGSLGTVAHRAKISGIAEGDVSHPHQIIYDQNEALLFVPAQGRRAGFSKTMIFRFDSIKGFSEEFTLYTRERAEARHVTVHPNNNFVYLVNEKDNTVCFHLFNQLSGILEPVQILSTLPETYTGNGQASGIIMSPDGKHVYVSNRIHNSITIYAVDEQSGMLKTCGWVSTFGKTPRFITIDPTGKFLYAANEDSDSIIVFRLGENGNLIYSGHTVRTGSPVCIVFS